MRKTWLNILFIAYLLVIGYLLWLLQRQISTTFSGPYELALYGPQLAAILGGVLFRLDHLITFCQHKQQPVQVVVPHLLCGIVLIIISMGRLIFLQLSSIPLPEFFLDTISGRGFPLLEVAGFAGAVLLIECWRRAPQDATQPPVAE